MSGITMSKEETTYQQENEEDFDPSQESDRELSATTDEFNPQRSQAENSMQQLMNSTLNGAKEYTTKE